jgi:protein-S-isoprenylcysteine O-methyltransferase Ste14
MTETPPAAPGTPAPAGAAPPAPEKKKDIRHWYFRRRGWPLVFFNLFWIVEYTGVSRDRVLNGAIGAAFILLALGIRLWAISHLGWRSARTHREKAKALVMAGPYGLVRNPLYVANSFACLGLCAIGGLLWYVPVLFVLLFAHYTLVVKCEESFLLERFGEPYAEYLRRVPRWLPNPFAKRMPPAEGLEEKPRESFGRMLWGEHRGMAAVVLGVGLALLKDWAGRHWLGLP